MDAILRLSDVSYQYKDGHRKVLQNINIEFEKGKLYVIMGKSGAGKSTLLSLISGLDLCTEGEIFYADQEMQQLNRDDYRGKNIGVIFQSYNLLLNATVLENIILSMNISGVKGGDKKKTALKLLKKVGIDEETAGRKILKLSGGEQQRVGIARALAHDPDLLIADEPTGNLDSETEQIIMNIFKSLAHKENKCVIVVTHSKEVSKYADEIWGLNQGNLVFVK